PLPRAVLRRRVPAVAHARPAGGPGRHRRDDAPPRRDHHAARARAVHRGRLRDPGAARRVPRPRPRRRPVMTPSTPAIEIRGLHKRFGHVTALDGLDLTVAPGEIAGFLGPNGAGKSTTIRVLLGLLRADAGDVRLLGGDPWADAV